VLEESASPSAHRRIRARLSSSPSARLVRVLFAPGSIVHSVRVAGKHDVEPAAKGEGNWKEVSFAGAGAGGVEIEIETDDDKPLELVLEDESSVLPDAARSLARARPPWVRSIQVGDAFRIHRKVTLEERR
jgi:hypothetical protein